MICQLTGESGVIFAGEVFTGESMLPAALAALMEMRETRRLTSLCDLLRIEGGGREPPRESW